MRPLLSLIVLLACSVSFTHAITETTELINTGPQSLGAGVATNLGTLTNGDLDGERVITLDLLVTRQEGSGGDTWFGIGANSSTGSTPAVVTTADVGFLTRMRTDSGTAHQAFGIPGTEGTANSSTSTTKRANATITLSTGGIAAGQLADIVVRYDDNNDGTTDHIVGGTFDWTANSAAINLAAHNKAYDFEITANRSASNFDLFDTGVDANGAVQAAGTADSHWTITASPAGPFGPATVQANHPAWLANDAAGTVGGSSWISVVPAGTTNVAQGDYVFEQTFSLNHLDPTSAVIVLDIAVDNTVTDILLNGVSQMISTGGFASFNGPFEITSGFQSGENTLSILVNNAGGSANPGGLRVQVLQATATDVPEPATGLLALLGGIGLLKRRRTA